MKELDRVYAQNIANEYAPKTDSDVIALKKLDKKVKRPALIFGYGFGTLSTLVMGMGMSICLKALEIDMIWGLVAGLVGMSGMIATYPIYRAILQNRKEEYANDIIALADKIADR